MAARGIALLGGSFNPIHNGHLIVARAVAEMLCVDRMVLIPAAQPPHKAGLDLAMAADRLEMVRMAVADEPLLEVNDIELQRSGPSYTFLTVEKFLASLEPGLPLYWVIGGDTLPELHTWYRIRELVDRCRIVTAVRPGYDAPDLTLLARVLSPEQIQQLRCGILPTPRIDISATQVRRRVAAGQSIRYLVPEIVADYIMTHGLYGARRADG